MDVEDVGAVFDGAEADFGKPSNNNPLHWPAEQAGTGRSETCPTNYGPAFGVKIETICAFVIGVTCGGLVEAFCSPDYL